MMDLSKPPTGPQVGLKALPEELIQHILEDLYKVLHVAHLRVVSRQFDRIIVPITYRRVTLTTSITGFVLSGPRTLRCS